MAVNRMYWCDRCRTVIAATCLDEADDIHREEPDPCDGPLIALGDL